MEATPRAILICQDKNGREPLIDWLKKAADKLPDAPALYQGTTLVVPQKNPKETGFSRGRTLSLLKSISRG